MSWTNFFVPENGKDLEEAKKAFEDLELKFETLEKKAKEEEQELRDKLEAANEQLKAAQEAEAKAKDDSGDAVRKAAEEAKAKAEADVAAKVRDLEEKLSQAQAALAAKPASSSSSDVLLLQAKLDEANAKVKTLNVQLAAQASLLKFGAGRTGVDISIPVQLLLEKEFLPEVYKGLPTADQAITVLRALCPDGAVLTIEL